MILTYFKLPYIHTINLLLSHCFHYRYNCTTSRPQFLSVVSRYRRPKRDRSVRKVEFIFFALVGIPKAFDGHTHHLAVGHRHGNIKIVTHVFAAM
jgi:hypothetical protein